MRLKKSIKMDEEQTRASQPNAHIWVNANAGTGKTTILTSRVLRLLLNGISPIKILCLTYTKAAASEMLNRINQTLASWAICSEEELNRELTTLLEIMPSQELKKRARSLFIEVLETHEGLKVQTIHSFAQSILRRFPIEAGISPYFTLMDEQEAQTVGETALSEMLSHSAQGLNPILREALEALLQEQSEYLLKKTLNKSLNDVMKWNRWLMQSGGAEQAGQKLAAYLGVDPHETNEALTQEFIDSGRPFTPMAEQALQVLHHYPKGKSNNIPDLMNVLHVRISNGFSSEARTNKYLEAFITKESGVRDFISKLKVEDEIKDYLLNEAERCQRFACKRSILSAYIRTVNFYKIAEIYLLYYERLCDRLGVMDYQQLLMKTEQLLSSQHRISGWVMYKLDGGLEHILVDEAQDTSPEQWEIIRSLTSEFFSGESAKDTGVDRTLFIVGDEKQSIFSFQGADAAEFKHMREWFSDKVQHSKLPNEKISLENSYRSSAQILNAVNATVKALGFTSHHQVTKDEKAYPGKVVLWPYIEPSRKNKTDAPTNAIEGDEESDLQQQLAERIGEQIAHWLANGKCNPEDIMLLVRTRTSLVEALARACRERNIPVTSVDRNVISEHLAVRDLLALGRWLTLPENDYDLACVLRSPIGQLSEETLFELAHNRGKETLWHRLKNASANKPGLTPLVEILEKLLKRVDYDSPYQMFHSVIFSNNTLQRFKTRMGEDVETIFADFLKQVDMYERKFPASMQLVLDAMECNLATISRTEGDKHAVRIMTVHGSKGLEANIVILADAASSPKPRDSLIWTETENQNFAFFPPKSEFCTPVIQELLEVETTRRNAEYQRLLYVAITRAKQELYITGFKNKNNNIEKSWYHTLEKALGDIAEIKTFELEKELHSILEPEKESQYPNQETPETKPFLVSNRNHQIAEFLSPSRTTNLAEPVNTKDDIHWEKRIHGKVMHSALQLLKPPVVKVLDQPTIERIVHIAAKRHGYDAQDLVIEHIWKLIKHPQTAFLFENALVLNETAISGQVNIADATQQFSAQVDKAVMVANTIWVVDFKTSAQIPDSIESTPKSYLRQIAIYKALLQELYPKYPIQAALVWTHPPHLQPISEQILSQVLLDEAVA